MKVVDRSAIETRAQFPDAITLEDRSQRASVQVGSFGEVNLAQRSNPWAAPGD